MSALQIQCVMREEDGLGAKDVEDGVLAEVIPFPRIVPNNPPSYAPPRVRTPGESTRRSNLGSQTWGSGVGSRTTHRGSSIATEKVGSAPTLLTWAARISVYAVMAAALFALAAAVGLAIRPAPYSGPTWEHSVAEGESVWSLAASIGSDRLLEDVVTDIYSLNSLGEGPLVVGQEILLPSR